MRNRFQAGVARLETDPPRRQRHPTGWPPLAAPATERNALELHRGYRSTKRMALGVAGSGACYARLRGKEFGRAPRRRRTSTPSAPCSLRGRQLRIRSDDRDPEVHHIHTLTGENDVARFDITVHHAALVRGLQGVCYEMHTGRLPHDVCRRCSGGAGHGSPERPAHATARQGDGSWHHRRTRFHGVTVTPAQQRAGRVLFLRLVKIGDGAEDTRRRVARADLLSGSSDQQIMQAVLDVFTRDRLLTQGDETRSRSPMKSCCRHGHVCGAGSTRTGLATSSTTPVDVNASVGSAAPLSCWLWPRPAAQGG